jgi:hypothetical protein
VSKIFQYLLAVLILFLVFGVKTYSQNDDIFEYVDSMTTLEIDTTAFNDKPLEILTSITDYAIEMSLDTVDSKKSYKGIVLLDAISVALRKMIANQELDPKDEQVSALIKTYHQLKFTIYNPKPNDLKKLIHYLCEGKYRYVYKRASGVPSFYFFLTLLVIGIIFYIISLLKLIRFQHQALFNKACTIIIFVLLIASILFKLTCHNYA